MGCISQYKIRFCYIFMAAMDHHRVKITSQCLHTEHFGFDENAAGPAERIKHPVSRMLTGYIDKCPGHPRHHHTRVEKVPFSGIADIIGSAINIEEYFTEKTPVLRKDSAVYC